MIGYLFYFGELENYSCSQFFYQFILRLIKKCIFSEIINVLTIKIGFVNSNSFFLLFEAQIIFYRIPLFPTLINVMVSSPLRNNVLLLIERSRKAYSQLTSFVCSWKTKLKADFLTWIKFFESWWNTSVKKKRSRLLRRHGQAIPRGLPTRRWRLRARTRHQRAVFYSIAKFFNINLNGLAIWHWRWDR